MSVNLNRQKEGKKMKKYYYVVIDKKEKTLQVLESESCLATTEEKVKKIYKLSTRLEVETRFSFFFNGTEEKINFETLYKYARKYKVVSKSVLMKLFIQWLSVNLNRQKGVTWHD